MPKDKLLKIMNNKKGGKKSLLKLKKGRNQKMSLLANKNSLFKLRREKIKKSHHKPTKKTLFKSKINEI